jgi:hypothetical protein
MSQGLLQPTCQSGPYSMSSRCIHAAGEPLGKKGDTSLSILRGTAESLHALQAKGGATVRPARQFIMADGCKDTVAFLIVLVTNLLWCYCARGNWNNQVVHDLFHSTAPTAARARPLLSGQLHGPKLQSRWLSEPMV